MITRQAAVLALDIASYSVMMERDEIGTYQVIRAHRQELIDGLIVGNGGRIIKFTGDGMLIEFTDSATAVATALRIQRGMHDRNLKAAEPEQVRYRMGLNAGTIIVDREDVFGNDVNIAARLEALAEPGGICISRRVYDRIGQDQQALFEDRGTPALKHIDQPVQVFAAPGAAVARLPPFPPMPARNGTVPRAFRAAAEPAARCAVAVLPFTRVGGDTTPDYFCDGLTTDITDALSCFRELFVIASQSTFTFRGQAASPGEIAAGLGVRYLVTGDVRRASDRLRITCRLVDTETGQHLSAGRFEGANDDLFALQDEITQRIVTTLHPRLRTEEINRARRKPVTSLDAYDFYLRALPYRETYTEQSFAAAADLLDEALALDPDYGPALVLKAFCRGMQFDRAWPVPGVDTRAASLDLTARAMAAAPDDPMVLCIAGHTISIMGRDPDQGLLLLSRALELNPNYAEAWMRKAWIHVYRNEMLLAVEHADRAIELNPLDPLRYFGLGAASIASFFLTNYEYSYGYARQALQLPNAPFWIHLFAMLSSEAAGRLSDLQAHRATFEARFQGFDVLDWLYRRSPWTDPRHLESLRAGFARIGFHDNSLIETL